MADPTWLCFSILLVKYLRDRHCQPLPFAPDSPSWNHSLLYRVPEPIPSYNRKDFRSLSLGVGVRVEPPEVRPPDFPCAVSIPRMHLGIM